MPSYLLLLLMPRLEYDLHHWPGYSAPVIASVVRHAVRSANGAERAAAVQVVVKSPFAARVSVDVRANLAGVVARATETTLARLAAR
jgi:hypothetical protein